MSVTSVETARRNDGGGRFEDRGRTRTDRGEIEAGLEQQRPGQWQRLTAAERDKLQGDSMLAGG